MKVSMSCRIPSSKVTSRAPWARNMEFLWSAGRFFRLNHIPDRRINSHPSGRALERPSARFHFGRDEHPGAVLGGTIQLTNIAL